MSRSVLLVCALSILCCMAVESSAQAASTSDTAQNGVVLSRLKLTRDEAIAAVRSKETTTGFSFQVIRELDSSAAKQEAAQRAIHEAFSHHTSLYGDGILLDLLNAGGFLILEVDDTTGNAISLHLVSSGTDGRAVVKSRPIEGKIKANLAQDLITDTADFVDVLFATSLNMSTIESRFYGGRFPESDEPEEENFFAIPRGIQKLKADQSEIRELAALVGAFHFWPIRYAVSMPLFPASPTRALEFAWRKHEALFKEFTHTNNDNPNFLHDLHKLETARTPEQLRDRVATFRNLNNFLEQQLRKQDVAPILSDNRSIFTIPLDLGSTEPPDEISYYVMTASGVIVSWRPLKTGGFAVARVSLAGD